MAPYDPYRPAAFASVATPALIPFALGDANTSIGVVGLMLAIILLVAALIAVIIIEVTGEHRENVEHHIRHRH